MVDDNYKLRGLRNKLVKKLREKGIKDETVLAAVGRVPRHVFFENALIDHAYQDKAFPIGEGQTISQPYTVAFQSEKLEIKPGDRVLEIGTGSGYQACILLEMGAKVFTIEYNRTLYETAREMLPGGRRRRGAGRCCRGSVISPIFFTVTVPRACRPKRLLIRFW